LPPNLRFRVVELPIFDANSRLGLEIRERVKNGDLDGIDPAALLTEANIQFVTNFTPQFKVFVREVLAAQGKPVLFHCTAGKDRTGFAAAVLLRLLGVPQEIVTQDYLLSQANILSGHARDLALGRLMFGTAAVRVVEGLLSVNAAYLQAAFDTIDSMYGSFDAYARDGLGLHDTDIAALRAALLEA
jgi:protein-tyrosine phosphatase